MVSQNLLEFDKLSFKTLKYESAWNDLEHSVFLYKSKYFYLPYNLLSYFSA